MEWAGSVRNVTSKYPPLCAREISKRHLLFEYVGAGRVLYATVIAIDAAIKAVKLT